MPAVLPTRLGRTSRPRTAWKPEHHGNVLWLMGGSIQGGQRRGAWPGLADEQLYEGRDLAVTTDFRKPISPCSGLIFS